MRYLPQASTDGEDVDVGRGVGRGCADPAPGGCRNAEPVPRYTTSAEDSGAGGSIIQDSKSQHERIIRGGGGGVAGPIHCVLGEW